MYLITSQSDFARYIPNILKAVQGEASVYQKTQEHLARAEKWLTVNIVDAELLEALDADAKDTAAHIVVNMAFYAAVPSLDLVLTPNGFGIVNNANVVPASKERVERLRLSLMEQNDTYIDTLLGFLATNSDWLSSSQAKNFRRTLFPTLEVCALVKDKASSSVPSPVSKSWGWYLRLRRQTYSIEAMLEVKYFSTEQMDVFREEVQKGIFANRHEGVISRIRTFIVGKLSNSDMQPASLLSDAVDIIRKNPEDFAEWHASTVKDLWEDRPIFENKKENGAYFF